MAAISNFLKKDPFTVISPARKQIHNLFLLSLGLPGFLFLIQEQVMGLVV
jgi:hypothetical protein